MPNIGDHVLTYIPASNGQSVEIEGIAEILGLAPGHNPNRFIVQFADGKVGERLIDSLSDVLGPTRYLQFLNEAVAELARSVEEESSAGSCFEFDVDHHSLTFVPQPDIAEQPIG